MKAAALITLKDNQEKSQWQFDMVMSAIAFELDLSIIFIDQGCQQISKNKAWKSLSIYGIDNVYFFNQNNLSIKNPLFEARSISHEQMIKIIQNTDIIL